MSSINDYQAIEIELTSQCNIRCPGCARNVHGDTNPNLKLETISYETFIKRIPQHVLKGKSISFCGAFGEPLMHKDFIKILEYIVDCGAKNIGIDTNGSLRTKEWWERLGKIQKTHVTFSVDGHKETNHLYRVRAKFDKIIENMKAFKKAGGNGTWKYIVFQHNQHEIDIAREEAKKLGLNFQTMINTRIPDKSWPTYKEIESKTKVNHIANKFIENKKNFVNSDLIEVMQHKAPTPIKEKKISCWMLNEFGLFLGFDGKVWPCCYFNSVYHEYTFLSADEQDSYTLEKNTGKYLHHLDNYYGKNWNSIYHKTWEQILEHDFYKNHLSETLKTNPLTTCIQSCTKTV